MTQEFVERNPATLRIVLARDELNVRDVQDFMEALDAFAMAATAAINWRRYAAAAEEWPFEWPFPYDSDARVYLPRVVAVRNESPVTVILEHLDVPLVIGFMAYLINHPAHLRTWLSRYRISRDVAKAKEHAARAWAAEVEQLTATGVDVSELPEPPDWIFRS